MNNTPKKCKIFSLNNHEKIKMLSRTEHMNEEERSKILSLCHKYKDCFYNEQEKVSATNSVKNSIRIKDEMLEIFDIHTI